MVSFNNLDEMKAFIERAGGTIVIPDDEKHYLIIGAYIQKPIGCTWDRLDVLFEEPEATFEEIDPDQCPVCKE